jgi:GntR family transcriptional repressor for pyruvate dehydrogenase complex
MVYPKLSVTRIPEAIAHELETRLLEGSLKPGDRLPAERELAAELGVSRPSLREAIQKLVSRNLLVSRQGGGTYVTDRLDARFSDPWQQLIDQHPSLQGDVLEFRYLLEASAAELAAQRATDADLQRLQEAFALLEAAYRESDRSAQVSADVAFHPTIAEAAHNALFGHLTASLLRLLHDHVRRNISDMSVGPEIGRCLMEQHSAIHQAIVDRQPELARQAAQAHIDYVRNRLDEAARAGERQQRALRHLA